MKKKNMNSFNNTAFIGSIFGTLFQPMKKVERVKHQDYVPINMRRV